MLRIAKKYLCSCITGVVEQTAGMSLPDENAYQNNPLRSPVAYDVGRISAAGTGLAVAILSQNVPSSVSHGANLVMDVNRLSTDIRRQEHVR